MKKLIQGIVEFRKNRQGSYRETLGRLALGQSPDTLFIACSDSRVVPNTFASTNPGDLFVVRNVGNLIPPCGHQGHSVSDAAEAAAIEFSVLALKVRDVVVCGHSECGAMLAIDQGRERVSSPNLKGWLRHAEHSLKKLQQSKAPDPLLSPHNQLSQANVLQQMEHIMTYPIVQERVKRAELHIHGWWFDIRHADVYAYESELNRFVLIDEVEASRLLQRLEEN